MNLLPKDNLILADLAPVFSETALKCVREFLGKPGRIDDEWEVVERLEADFDYILTMGGASPRYQSILALGVNNADLVKITSGDPVEFLDMLGEFANTYCALLMDRDEFTSHFGILNQSIAIMYSKGTPFLPFISGVQGKVITEGVSLFLGYAIQRVGRKNINSIAL